VRHAVITLFELSSGEVCVGISVQDPDGTQSSCFTYTEPSCELWPTFSMAYDAVFDFWRHGLLYSQPLGERGWQTRLQLSQ